MVALFLNSLTDLENKPKISTRCRRVDLNFQSGSLPGQPHNWQNVTRTRGHLAAFSNQGTSQRGIILVKRLKNRFWPYVLAPIVQWIEQETSNL